MYHMKWVARVQSVKYLPILDTDHDYHLATGKEKNKIMCYYIYIKVLKNDYIYIFAYTDIKYIRIN